MINSNNFNKNHNTDNLKKDLIDINEYDDILNTLIPTNHDVNYSKYGL